jgi:hypothetical protein
MAENNGTALRRALLDIQLEKIQEEKFPSATMMNRVEGALETQDQVEDYVTTLLAKVRSERYPSIPMINRIEGLLDSLG